jgi:OOP family OmpA-OmpF porin
MAESLFSSLRATVDQAAIGHIAGSLGQPEQTASRGVVASIAALLAGLMKKADDSSGLRNLLESSPSGVSWHQVAGGLSESSSPIVATGKRILASLFGGGEGAVINGIGRETGMGTGATSSLLAATAPMVLSFVNTRVREDHLSMTELRDLLRRETSSIQSALPASLREMFWPSAESGRTPRAEPSVAAAAARPSSRWIPALIAGLICLAIIVFLGYRHRRHAGEVAPVPSGGASRAGQTTSALQEVTLPNGVKLNIPRGGMEANLLAFLQNPNAKVDPKTWFNFDRLTFDPGSAQLQPDSDEQINNIAAILAAYPNVRLRIAGFTDNVGSTASNMELARNRAAAVAAALSNRGITADRLTTEAYGPRNAIASNATEAGRSQNRRVAIQVTQK